MAHDLSALLASLADRDKNRTEATVQAEVRQLLLDAPLNLRDEVLLESQVGDRRRIDVEVGATIIEVKKDLRVGNVRADAVTQLEGYVQSREAKFATRFVGVLTDGAEWRCYHLADSKLAEVSTVTVQRAKPDVDALVAWLEGVLATTRDVKPTPDAIRERLGAPSSAYALDRATLAALYAANKANPSVHVKRRLWARLLETALGTQFVDSDELFVEHTLLVNSAEIIAHAVIGLPVAELVPRALLSGAEFESAGVHGVVEADFFDWVVEVARGDAFIRSLGRRLARFDWSAVEHDVLKVLYESIITPETRKKLGEYYTPDWLAQKVVEAAVPEPLKQRVLDPACGSGTFLFHAVRRYLAAARAKKLALDVTLRGVTSHVFGMDLHPVAVTLARVTYILAIGRKNLVDDRRGDFRVPVLLDDSMRWACKTYDLPTRNRLSENRVDVLVGNPPWLSFRFMPAEMQKDFREMCVSRGIWAGAKVATHQDLSGLFVARVLQLYLKDDGRFAFVMPDAVLDRDQFEGFRGGAYADLRDPVAVRFTQPWNLRRLRPHFFPRGAAVIFGRRDAKPVPMPKGAEGWSGTLPSTNAPWSAVAKAVTRAPEDIKLLSDAPLSPHHKYFRQGATIVPRVLFMVERKNAGPLGISAGKASVRSVRSASEKKPWRDLPNLEGVVENQFVRPVHLGETVLPYRTLKSRLAVLPLEPSGEILAGTDTLQVYNGMYKWWNRVDALWNEHRSSDRLTLVDRLNFHAGLRWQFPLQPQRIVYSKSGMHLSAARMLERRAIIDHTLYWANARHDEEAFFLCAILNAACVTTAVRPLMSYGKDERHIDKYVWRLPIPEYDEADALHVALAARGKEAEEAIAALPLEGEKHFAASRRKIRAFLAESEVGQKIEALVTELLERG